MLANIILIMQASTAFYNIFLYAFFCKTYFFSTLYFTKHLALGGLILPQRLCIFLQLSATKMPAMF